MLLRIPRYALAQRFGRIPEMIAFLVGNPVAPVVSRKRGYLHQFRQPVDIEEDHEQRVSKFVAHRTEPAMTQRSRIDSRFHQAATSLGASHDAPSVSRHADRRIHSVFMEPVEPVCAAEVRTVVAADLTPTRLGSHGVQGIKRMEVRHLAQNVALGDGLRVVQRDAIVFPCGQALQTVHVIRQRSGSPFGAEMVVPRGTRSQPPGQQARVGVQHGLVAAGAETTQAPAAPVELGPSVAVTFAVHDRRRRLRRKTPADGLQNRFPLRPQCA